jgi:putative Holliday junction resolvase
MPPRAMGLDVGERRVGVAVADELGTIASPVTAVLRRDGDLEEIRDLASARGVGELIVGLPVGLSGREGPQAASVRAFADALQAMVGSEMPIIFWDERLTTAVAERSLRERGGRRKGRQERRGEVDAMAAAVILQGYLDARRARSRRLGNPDSADAR